MHTSFLACGIVAYYVVYDKVEWTVAEVTTSDVFFCSHAGRVIWKWWDYYLSSKSILSVLTREGRLHFTLLAGMSLVLISKECICVCLCKLGICTIFRLPVSNMILLWFLSALIYVICCYVYMYWLDSLPISFLTRPVEGLCSSPLLFYCTTVLELSLHRAGFTLVSCGY